MERALTLAWCELRRGGRGHLGHKTHAARTGFGRECGESIASATPIGRTFGFNSLGHFEGLRLFRWEMCVKAESFDVEEEVGRWSTDGR